ncbi:MAG: hypothetical protein U1F49_15010 [Rubrivivax sp.]
MLALLARTDHIVAISEHTAADVRRHLHWRGPLDVILNGAFIRQRAAAAARWLAGRSHAAGADRSCST